MARQYWVSQVPYLHVASGPAFNTFTTFQQILVNTTTPAPVIPGGSLDVGVEIHLDADGEFSTTATPTLGLGFMFGSTLSLPATTLAVGTAITTGTTGASWPWHAEWKGRVRAIGSAGSIQGAGWWMIGTNLATFSAAQAMPVTAAARTVTWDTTATQAIAPGAVWGTSSVSNTIRVDRFSVWVTT